MRGSPERDISSLGTLAGDWAAWDVSSAAAFSSLECGMEYGMEWNAEYGMEYGTWDGKEYGMRWNRELDMDWKWNGIWNGNGTETMTTYHDVTS